jgi:cbb3-type cytochrome oxidase maturation protein
MTIVWILFICSVVLLPGMALWAFSWALRHGEFKNLEKTALSIFDEEEPVGQPSDHFPVVTSPGSTSKHDHDKAPPMNPS